MTTLRNLNRAVQSAEFPSHEWAQAVREWIDKATERIEGGMKTCPRCGDLTTIDHNVDDGTPEG